MYYYINEILSSAKQKALKQLQKPKHKRLYSARKKLLECILFKNEIKPLNAQDIMHILF